MKHALPKKIAQQLGPMFSTIADKCSDLVWVRSKDFRQSLFLNSNAETVFGVSADALAKTPDVWMANLAAEDRDQVRLKTMEWLDDLSENSSLRLSYRVHLPNETLPLEELMMPIFTNKDCLGFLSIVRRVSQSTEHHSSNFLEDPSYYFRFFAEKSHNVFWVRDKLGDKQIYLSPAYEKIWGRSPKFLIENPGSWIDTLVKEDRNHNDMDIRLEETQRGEIYRQYENRYRIRRPDGEIRWIKDTNYPINNEKGELIGFAGIAEDITEDALREQELRDAKERAENANRAKSDFLAMMSHELRTPLNAILGMSQILVASQLTEAQRDQIEVIETSGQNLLGLLNDVLDFAKLEVGKLSFRNESFDLLGLLQKLQADLAQSAKEKKLELRFDIDKEMPRYVKGDPKRVRQVLTNLVSNAIKYTEHGHVILAASCPQKTKHDGNFRFVVHDTGIGIPKDKLEKVFLRFQQVDSVYQRKRDGVGLGLAIVKELIERMGGSIAVNSELGKGSEFTCILPLHLEAQRSILSEPTAEYRVIKQFQQFNAKILVVEDNAINQKIAVALLEQLGCIVDIVDNGEAALEKYEDGYDLIFLDIGLPDMDGFEVGDRMRKNAKSGKHVPIIALTAHVFAQDRKRCFDVGMDEVMAKPIMRDDLIAVLGRWTEKRT